MADNGVRLLMKEGASIQRKGVFDEEAAFEFVADNPLEVLVLEALFHLQMAVR
jgi:hypothetical protein